MLDIICLLVLQWYNCNVKYYWRFIIMRTITVKGVGNVTVKPDFIVVSMKLKTEAKEYDRAMELASEKIEQLNKSLENIGFEKSAVKTTNFNVQTAYENVKDVDGRYKSVFNGYVCNHNLKVEFDLDMAKLSKVLSTISVCLAKPEFSIAFTIKDSTIVKNELLKSAVQNAKQKAEILCLASGVKLGELTSIEYNWGDINVYSNTDYRVDRCMMKASSNLANIDIEPDDINVNDSATFVWEIL